MREPSFIRLAIRSLLLPLAGIGAEGLEYCRMRDRLWALYKKNRRLSHAEVFGHSMRFLRFEDFMRLLDEIFGRKIYSFKTADHRPLIFDLGANIGMSILFFKRLFPEARIIAFEPDPRTFEVLQSNVQANGWKNVELHPLALAGREGEIDFFTDTGNRSSLVASVYGHRVSGTVKQRVKAAPLSKFLGQPADFVKIDIEGSEAEVFQELASSGSLAKIKSLAVEYHHHLVPEEDKLASFLKIFEDHGFGYSISAPFQHPDSGKHFQDILIHAWQK